MNDRGVQLFSDVLCSKQFTAALNEWQEEVQGAREREEGKELLRTGQSDHIAQSTWEGGREGEREGGREGGRERERLNEIIL